VTVLTDEGPRPQTFESRQSGFRTAERLQRFLADELSFGELEGLERAHLDWALRAAWELSESGDLEAAQRILLALALADHRNPEVLLRLAVVTEGLGQNAEALRFYRRTLELAPDRVEALVGRGELLLDLGRLEEATADLARAIDLDPGDLSAAAARARRLLQGILRAADLRLGPTEPSGDEAGGRPAEEGL
jgi:tetratricopeptide (TPR) repeat protein